MSKAAADVSGSTRDSSLKDTSMETAANLDVTSRTVQDMSETIIADVSATSSDAGLDTTWRTVRSLDETMRTMIVSPERTLEDQDNSTEPSSAKADGTIADLVDMSETVCFSLTIDVAEETVAFASTTMQQDAFSDSVLPDEDLGSTESFEHVERLRSGSFSQHSSVGSQVEGSDASDVQELSPIYSEEGHHRYYGQESGEDDDNPTLDKMESLDDRSEVSSNEDVCYRPCRETCSSATATGRFLVARDIPEASSSTEDDGGSDFEYGVPYTSDPQYMSKGSKDGIRSGSGSCVLQVGPKDSTRMGSRGDDGFRSVANGKSSTSSASRNIFERPVPMSRRGAPLSPIVPTGGTPQRKEYSSSSRSFRERSPEGHMPQVQDDGAFPAEAVGTSERVDLGNRQPAYRHHRYLHPGDDALDDVLYTTPERSGRRFFRHRNLRKAYMKQYLNNPEYRRICKHSKKYFENGSSPP